MRFLRSKWTVLLVSGIIVVSTGFALGHAEMIRRKRIKALKEQICCLGLERHTYDKVVPYEIRVISRRILLIED